MQGTNEIRNVLYSAINPAGIVRWNIVYIPRYGVYRVTLVSRSSVVDAGVIANIIEKLKSTGYNVYMKTSKSLLGKTGVIVLYVTKRAK